MKGILILASVTLWVWFFPFTALSEDEYEFDLSEIENEIEKKPYSLAGFFELKPVLFGPDRDSAFYKIKFYDKDEGSTLEQYNSGLRLEGSYHKGIADLFFRADSRLWYEIGRAHV